MSDRTDVSQVNHAAPSLRGSKTSPELSLRVYESLGELSALRPAWDELLSCYPLATTFSTWEWLSCWWNCFGTKQQLLTLALFDSESLVALAPLSISRERRGLFPLRVLRLMGDGSGDSDNLDLPVRPGFEGPFAEAILRYLRQEKRRWDVCLLNTLPFDSPAALSLTNLLNSSAWTFCEYSSRSSAVPLPETWERYLQMLSSEDRKNLSRYTRRLQARHSTRIYRCSAAEEIPLCVDALMRLHQARWQSAGEPGTFSSQERRDFYGRLSRCLLERGWLELWVLELDGEIAAVQFAFRYGDRVFQLQEGYDHNRSSDRPGYVLRGAVLQQLISDKVRSYDFLGGEDQYKARWGARSGTYRLLHFAPALSLGGASLQCIDKAGRGKEWLRHEIPAPVWNLLRRARGAVAGRVEPDEGAGPGTR